MRKLLLLFLLAATMTVNAEENPVLTIEGGQVQGVTAMTTLMCMSIAEYHTLHLLSRRTVGKHHSL